MSGRSWSHVAPTLPKSVMKFISHIRYPARACSSTFTAISASRKTTVSPIFWLKRADFARTGAEPDDTEGLIDHIRDIKPVVVACVFEEIEPELTRISLRSKDDKINVNEIAAQFNGGGHSAAAGARISGKPLSVQRKVIKAIRKAINSTH